MEVPGEELVMVSGYGGDCAYAVVKGKRTKRQRVVAAAPAPAVVSPSTSEEEAVSGGGITEEEEDMANCLILLAQGRGLDEKTEDGGGGGGGEKLRSRRFAEAPTTTDGKAGFYVYQCKTCNKCFPSFQALGGHRASHKRPKMAVAAMMVGGEERKPVTDEVDLQIAMDLPERNVGGGGGVKARVHECSICGAEFASGQALGGHMRRHRPLSIAESPEAKKDRNLLSLDLNLPAPSDDDHRPELQRPPPLQAFTFAGKRPLVFSSALVDCHY